MWPSILAYIFGNSQRNQNTPGTGYGNYGYWGNYGRTNPEYWQNLNRDTGYGNWGNNQTPYFNYGQGTQNTSLLDMLSRLNRSQYGGY
jgi:carbonic anhydrase